MQVLMSTVNARFDWAATGLGQDRFIVVNQLAPAAYALRRPVPRPAQAPAPPPPETRAPAVAPAASFRRYDPSVAEGFAALDEPRERGLAHSRNRALDLASDEICLLGDDDQHYVPDVVERVEEAFARFPEADILTFAERTPDGTLRRRYPPRPRPHSLFSAGRVRTPEIAFRLSRVEKVGVRFDADFGYGAEYRSGEEYVFLADALRKNLKVWFVPSVISFHPAVTTAARGHTDRRLMHSKGAMMARVFGWAAPLGMLAFAAKKTAQARMARVEAASFRVRMAEMLRGWSDYRRSNLRHAREAAPKPE